MKLISHRDKIFIAGSTGMVGSAISRTLKRNGYFNQLNPTRNELDLMNHNDVNRWMKKNKPEVLIIAAAKVGGIEANRSKPTDFLYKNVQIQNNLIKSAYDIGVKRLLFLGSSCIYPKFAKQPILEEYLLSGSLEETNESYAIAKICGIQFCKSLRREKNFDAICLMPTNLYGPGDNYHPTYSHVMPSLIRKFLEASKNNLKTVKCWGTGSPLREFLYVDDLAESCLFSLENWDPKRDDAPIDSKGNKLCWLNVGSNYEISIKDLAKKISKITSFKGEIIWDKSKPDGTPRKKLNTKNLDELGWSAKTNLDQGIRKTIKYLKYSFK